MRPTPRLLFAAIAFAVAANYLVAWGAQVIVHNAGTLANTHYAGVPVRGYFWRFPADPDWPDPDIIDTIDGGWGYRQYEVSHIRFERLDAGQIYEDQRQLISEAGWPMRAVRIVTQTEYGYDTTTHSVIPPNERHFRLNLSRFHANFPHWLTRHIPHHLALIPAPLGFTVNTLIYMTLYWLYASFFREQRSFRRVANSVCLDCGYDVHGLTTCPECGKDVPAN